MKRQTDLFQQIISFENLFLASRKARRGKRTKGNVMRFEMDVEEELFRLQEELATRTYTPGAYREFTIYERKPRKISAAPYRDRVVHHALCNIIEPIFERIFISDSYACRPGKGTHRAVDRFTEFSRKNRYVFKTDISKYFASIDHEILLQKIRKKIKCPGTLWLIKVILDGSNTQEEVKSYFLGDDLFAPFRRRRGIPIGNLTSQFFANVYLNDLDHFIKENLKCGYYIRYVDDLTIFENEKKKLWEIRDAIEDFLSRERLRLHPGKTYVSPVSAGIDHLGYVVYPDHRRLRKDNPLRFRRKLRKMSRLYGLRFLSLEKINSSVQSWLGHARHADTYGLREKILGGITLTKK